VTHRYGFAALGYVVFDEAELASSLAFASKALKIRSPLFCGLGFVRASPPSQSSYLFLDTQLAISIRKSRRYADPLCSASL
jgi:hypothetical protein